MLALLNIKVILFGVLLPILSACLLAELVHPYVIKIALLKDLVDKPGERKLQTRPIPVLGGVAVFFGLVIGIGIVSVFFKSYSLFPCVVALTVMMYIGLLDDILGLSPNIRLVIEVLMLLFIIRMDPTSINDFHGLFGIGHLPSWLSVPVCVFAGVGVINAINMIDGVDGLSSGLCIQSSGAFALAFLLAGDGAMTVMSCLLLGALLPFFFHNVFGQKTKIFLGDSGTLMIGVLMSVFCMHLVDNTSRVAYQFPNMGVIAFCLAVLSIPVFDTIRVMFSRMLKGISPFKADKTHLHHMFIRYGFSHVSTTICICSLNALNILVWFLSYQLGGNATVQFFVVLIISVFNTFGVYYILKNLSKQSKTYSVIKKLALWKKTKLTRIALFIRRIADRKMM